MTSDVGVQMTCDLLQPLNYSIGNYYSTIVLKGAVSKVISTLIGQGGSIFPVNHICGHNGANGSTCLNKQQ